MEGEFTQKETIEYVSAERVTQKKQTDNLKMEGTFDFPEKTTYAPITRPAQFKPKDNLFCEGTFNNGERSSLSDYKIVRGEKVRIVKQQDNLTISGSTEGKLSSILTLFRTQVK
jgi:hypothetical protein